MIALFILTALMLLKVVATRIHHLTVKKNNQDPLLMSNSTLILVRMFWFSALCFLDKMTIAIALTCKWFQQLK